MAPDRLAAPTPLEEHRKLAAFAGVAGMGWLLRQNESGRYDAARRLAESPSAIRLSLPASGPRSMG